MSGLSLAARLDLAARGAHIGLPHSRQFPLGRGFNVQVFDEDRLTFAWRCPRESNARFIAAGLRRDLLRNCWTKVGPARRQRV